MNFSPIGTTQNEPVGRSDVTVTYDAYGIPHIKGKTRAGMMFGAGWVMARDRGLLLPSAATPHGPPSPISPVSTRSRS